MPKTHTHIEVMQRLVAAGWLANGETRAEIVRMPMSSFGGRHDVSTGGRVRLRKGDTDRFVTIGPRTTCFYRKRLFDGKPHGQGFEFKSFSTKADLNAIYAEAGVAHGP